MTQSAFDLVDTLLDAGVPLVIIGGHAVNAHGFLRATEDIDIVFDRTSASESAMCDVLVEFGAFWIGDKVDPTTGLEVTHPVTLEYVRQNHMLMVGTNVGYLDVFDFPPGVPDATASELIASAVQVSGRPFVSMSWLRKLKLASGRPKDLLDLEHLDDLEEG